MPILLGTTLTILAQMPALAAVLVASIIVVQAREWTEVDSLERRLPCSQEVGDPPTDSETDGAQMEQETVAGSWDSPPNDILQRVEFQEGAQIEEETVSVWDTLPNDIHANILQRVEFRDLFRLKVLSNSEKKFIEGDVFRQARGGVSEGQFTAINYYIKNNVWRCSGYDLHSKSWRSLPPLSYLPPPDPELFKEYSVCGHGGLMCAEVSKLPKKGELVVFNPLTGEARTLPPLLYPRNPVLVHLWVDSAMRSYKVIVAGSSSASEEHLSKKVEVLDSSTSKWKEVCNVPGPAFGLNEHQAGVCLNGKLFLISFLENDCRRGVVAFDLREEKWLQNLTVPIPWCSYANTLQLVESDGKLFLFSEQESDRSVDHCIHELEFPDPEAGVVTCRWRIVVQFTKSGGRGLQVYPEDICVRFGEAKLCIFNTLSREGVVYDVLDGTKCEDLEPPPADQTGDNFFSLNPPSFTLEPNFDSDPSFPISHKCLAHAASMPSGAASLDETRREVPQQPAEISEPAAATPMPSNCSSTVHAGSSPFRNFMATPGSPLSALKQKERLQSCAEKVAGAPEAPLLIKKTASPASPLGWRQNLSRDAGWASSRDFSSESEE